MSLIQRFKRRTKKRHSARPLWRWRITFGGCDVAIYPKETR